MDPYIEKYLQQTATLAQQLDRAVLAKMVAILKRTRSEQGRLFILGVGGGAGNATHAVNDFRKIVQLEAYAPTDNVSELTARTNDEGWEQVFVRWLEVSRLKVQDCVLVFSVGGGNLEKNISANLVRALQYAKQIGCHVLGIVGRDGGYTAQVADAALVVPTLDPATVTPHTEAFQAVVWHCLVSHPELQAHEMKWESVK